MIFYDQDLSRYETCPRLAQLHRIYEPPNWPVREAVKQFFPRGIYAIMRGESPDDTVMAFLDQAANPGFTYPEGEPYVLAQDFACWLDGALRVIFEDLGELEYSQLDLYRVGENHLHVDGWRDSNNVIHVYRITGNLEDRDMRWPELCALAFEDVEVKIHAYKLPYARSGRLLSPLCMSYQHPTVSSNYRLARLEQDSSFAKSYKKIARWEIQPKVEWGEWRHGIDRDQCMNQIKDIYSSSPISDSYKKSQLRGTIEQLMMSLEKPHPKLREKCHDCIMWGLCHGDKDERARFRIPEKQAYDQFEKAMVTNGSR